MHFKKSVEHGDAAKRDSIPIRSRHVRYAGVLISIICVATIVTLPQPHLVSGVPAFTSENFSVFGGLDQTQGEGRARQIFGDIIFVETAT